MTIQEAIKTLEIAKAEVEWNYPLDYTIALDIAIEAMNKQIEKKPKRILERLYSLLMKKSRKP